MENTHSQLLHHQLLYFHSQYIYELDKEEVLGFSSLILPKKSKTISSFASCLWVLVVRGCLGKGTKGTDRRSLFATESLKP